MQLKFSAVLAPTGGLTITTSGVGGSWIVKLPSREFEGVSENEFSMMTLARPTGIDVPSIGLVDVGSIKKRPLPEPMKRNKLEGIRPSMGGDILV
ncbi:HipA domain-containing protein [Halomonas sp. KM007]